MNSPFLSFCPLDPAALQNALPEQFLCEAAAAACTDTQTHRQTDTGCGHACGAAGVCREVSDSQRADYTSLCRHVKTLSELQAQANG